MGDRERRRPKRAWPWLVGGPVLAAVGLVMLPSTLGRWAERDEYRAAPPCSELVTEDCLRETGAVVERTRVRRRKADRYLVWLRLDDPRVAKRAAGVALQLPEPDTIFSSLTPGRAVRVHVWDERIARIDVPGVGSGETEDSPLVWSLEFALTGYALLWWGAAATWFGIEIRTMLRTGADRVVVTRRGARAALGRLILSAAAGTVAGYLAIVVLDVYSPTVAAASVAGGSLAVWALLVGAARRRD